MPVDPKALNPADLQKLEHAFAADPASESYRPLAEAYLSMGRFMEAMVVCKKGVKAHPNVATPRVLLARVYAEQNKDKKALEELAGALKVAPADKFALRMTAQLQLKTGELDAGKANLLRVHEVDPQDGDTLALMAQHQIEAPKPVVVAPAPVLTPAALPRPAPAVDAQTRPSAPTQSAASPRASAPQPPPPPPSATRQRSSAPRPVQRDVDGDVAVATTSRTAARRQAEPSDWTEEDNEREVSARKSKKGSSRALFFALLFVVPIAVAAYFGVGQYRAKLIRDANKALREATDRLKADTYASYQQAIEASESALHLSASSDTDRNARGLLAYAYTIRWGEHQHDEANRERASQYLKEGLAAKEQSALLYAAEAMFAFYSGKSADAQKSIEARIKAAEADNKSVSIYYLTRGIILMNGGDLEAAKESLDRAQSIAPDDPRIYVALGNLHRRRGADGQALVSFNNALKFTRNAHPDGLLGTAKLILDQENPGDGYVTAARYVKTLQEMEPPPAPRQLAQAFFVKALLISRVSRDLPLYTNRDFQKRLEEATGIGADGARARADIQKAENDGSTLDRSDPELLLIRGRRLAWEGKLDEAVAELKRAIELNSHASHFHVELAKVLMKKEGGEAQAEEALKKALALVPNGPKLLAMLGQAQYRLRKIDEARATLERATADAKVRNPEARFLLGKILRDDKKDIERSLSTLERAAQEYFSDSSMAAVAYDELAMTYEVKGDRDRARANYEKALGADRDYATANCHYARLLSKMNDPREREKMKAAAVKVLELEPRGDCSAEMQRIANVQ